MTLVLVSNLGLINVLCVKDGVVDRVYECENSCLESANFFCSLVFLFLAMIEARLHYWHRACQEANIN